MQRRKALPSEELLLRMRVQGYQAAARFTNAEELERLQSQSPSESYRHFLDLWEYGAENEHASSPIINMAEISERSSNLRKLAAADNGQQ